MGNIQKYEISLVFELEKRMPYLNSIQFSLKI